MSEPMIIFENIDTNETVGINLKNEGKWYRAKLAAVINSSNISPNADRAQDFGWRLQPEQQALIEDWEQDSDMIQKVSTYTGTMLEDLTHPDFLAYLLHTLEAGSSPHRADERERRAKEADYKARVDALRANPVAPMRPFQGAQEEVPFVEYKEDEVEPVKPTVTKTPTPKK